MTSIVDIRKTELAHDILDMFKDTGIPMSDRIDIIEIVMKTLLSKKRLYDRRKK